MEILNYPFFYRALAAAVLISMACGAVGTYIVSRRITFMAGGISHAGFGGLGIAFYLGLNPLAGAGIFAVATALAAEKLSGTSRIRIDSVIGLLWAFGMATGIFFIHMTPGYASELTGYLFGSILTVSSQDLAAVAAAAVLVLFSFWLIFRGILFTSFDQEYAMTQGMPVKAVNYFLMALTALTIVISIRAVGIILVISMLTLPQVSAGLVTGDFRRMIFWSMFFGVISSVTGLFLSYYLDIPSGASIIFTEVLIFLIIRFCRGKIKISQIRKI